MSVSKEPLSIRNNNPGNLRFVGQPGATQGEGGFARFETPEAGLAAMRAQIELDTQTRGLTLDKFINKYAPPSENKTANYINFIAQKTGLDPRSTVPAERIGDVQRAMIEMEGGPRSLSYFSSSAPKVEPTQVAQAPTPAQEPRPTVQTASAQLPMSYRVALAANYLGDTEKDSVTDQAMQLLEELQSEDTGGGAGAVSKKLVSILSPKESGVDPFAIMGKAQEENQPRRKPVPRMPKLMAKGGEAKDDDRDLSDEDRQRMREEQEGRAMGGLRYNLGPIMGQVVKKPQGYEGRVSTPIGDVVPYMDFDPLTGTFRVTEYGVSTGRMGPEGGYEVKYSQPVVPGQKVPPQISGQYRKQLDRNSSVEASGFYVPIPGMKDAYGGNVRYVQRFSNGGEADYNQMAEQMTVGTVPEGKPGAAAQVAKDVVRGAQYLPYDLLGMPVDIATMAMRPFGYKTEKPFLGSEYLIDKAVQAGIADKPTGSLAETASRVGMGFVNPAAGARQVGRGIEALEKGAETLGTGAVRAITGKPEITPEQIYQAMGDTKGILQLGAPAAVKPGGGVTDTGGSLFLMEGSLLNTAASKYKARTGQEVDSWVRGAFKDSEEGKQLDAALDWMKTKAKNYFEKQYGSPNDPLLKAFEEGKYTPPALIPADSPIGSINKILPEEYTKILDAREMIRSSDPNEVAKGRTILSNFYDRATPVVAEYGESTVRNRLLNPRYREDIDQYIREELNLGLDEVSAAQMDSILDNFAKTGQLENAPFGRSDLDDAVAKNMIDSLATKIDIQGGKYGRAMESSLRYSADYPPKYATEAQKAEILRGEPTFTVTGGASGTLLNRDEVSQYLLRTPKEKWERMSLPEVLLAIDKDYAKITDPREIYTRIDNYKPVTTEQRMIGTKGFMPVKSETLGKGAGWREIVDEGGVLIEGRLLKHCFSEDPKYASFLKNNMSRFFSLRDNKGKAYATVQIDRLGQDGPFANIHQIKGFRNKPVADEYGKEIMDFINAYQKTIDVPLRYTELPGFLPKEVENLGKYGEVTGWSKGGMVDKPLYDRAA